MTEIAVEIETAMTDASVRMNWVPDVTAIWWGMKFTTQKATLLASWGKPYGTEGFDVPGGSLFRTPSGRYFAVRWHGNGGQELQPVELWGATQDYNRATIKHVSFEAAFPGMGDVPDA